VKVRILLLFLFFVALLLFAACRPDPVEIAVTVVHEVEVTVVREVSIEVTATPEPAGSLSEQPVVAPSKTVEPDSTATATLAPIQATIQALVAQVTIVPNESSSPVITAGDYPALLAQGCKIVRDNYVRGNFNDVDWEAICLQYQEEVKDIDDQDSFWVLMESLVAELGDDHSRFVRPDRFAAEFDLPGEGPGRPWPGFRIWPAREDERLLIWNVCDVGPASDAGLRRGDVILAINGQPVVRGENGFERGGINQAIYEKDDEATLLVHRGPDTDPEE
jgi:C-terminal processing protease CtpA/Prc